MRPRIFATLALTAFLLNCAPSVVDTSIEPDQSSATPTLAGPTAATSVVSSSAPAEGAWAGTWTKPGGGGAMTLELKESGATVGGLVTMVDSACIPPGTSLSGTLTGPNIVFTASGSGFQAVFGGNLNGNTMTGTLTASCAAGSATGTWMVTRN